MPVPSKAPLFKNGERVTLARTPLELRLNPGYHWRVAFDPLLGILDKLRSRYPQLGKRLAEAEAVSRWESAVGPAIAKHARAVRVQDGSLWVEVDHPIWKSELHHRKRQILDLLNGKRPAGEPALTDLLLVEPRRFT